MWLTAFNTAQAKTLSRLDALSAERDALFANSKAQAEDLGALSAQLETQAQGHAQALATATDAAKSDALAARDTLAALGTALAAQPKPVNTSHTLRRWRSETLRLSGWRCKRQSTG